MVNKVFLLLCLLSIASFQNSYGAEWSTSEVQIQYGELDTPSFAGGGKEDTFILTYQHASGWKYGDNFFFVDYLNDSKSDGFNDSDFYSEAYFNFSLNKISGKDFSYGMIKDVGVVLGLNLAGNAKVRKYLPGVRLSWDIPGFAFLNTDFTAYIDDSRGVSAGGAPKEDNSYMFDVSWAYPFKLGSQSFSIEGHGEFIGNRINEFGGEVESWILIQPQLRWDAGQMMFEAPNLFFVGLELQYWNNKLGDKSTDETAVQFLAVWRL